MKLSIKDIAQGCELTNSEMEAVRGGWHPFPRGLFGRDGKPFFGKDFVQGVSTVAPVLSILFPPAAPILAPIERVANTVGLLQQVTGH